MGCELTEREKTLMKAIVALMEDYLNGQCYVGMNPYARPCIKTGLKAIKEVTGFRGDYLDAIDSAYFREEVKPCLG